MTQHPLALAVAPERRISEAFNDLTRLLPYSEEIRSPKKGVSEGGKGVKEERIEHSRVAEVGTHRWPRVLRNCRHAHTPPRLTALPRSAAQAPQGVIPPTSRLTAVRFMGISERFLTGRPR